MAADTHLSFARYLEAKRTVDDRALNVRVWDRLRTELANQQLTGPRQVLEIGAGVGTMVERLRYASMLGVCRYTVLDSDLDLIDAAEIRLNSSREMQLDFVTADAFEFLSSDPKGRIWDLIVANAVLDLTDLSTSIRELLTSLAPGGLLYASINYDGLTAFLPVVDEHLDDTIVRLYNESMSVPRLDGTMPIGSRAGRTLIPALRDAGASVLEVGASDWIVLADETGYHADEAYFLRHILGFVEDVLMGHPELDRDQLNDWLLTRQRQITSGELIYVAHQLDILARMPVREEPTTIPAATGYHDE